ncbi:SpoIIE family protein phosphatase [Mycobacterium nebraskense]|uniref:histidine kinase n=3 Tax=Mycobacterium nebraskense TaxID=244292 RepID=A0A1X1ZYG1_9MYCO|nr:SpoIIE family protein phosphatase [Mycobacterium nebraskense]KLO42735.1 histidine kinase [Mycobacterium nebraskense]MBI2696439.1 SpoIIE family protein phosphatase [Mycobacterium nebraskense]MCV7120487.1 SpoIIE family protein phosphatase [Mycobacterium nebraskense]ORW31366.1 histidine kinase [Mycobacterium nebraskense]
MNPALPADLAAAVGLGGEMGRRFAEFDWDSHPLGSPQEWSAEVRVAVAVALTSRFPIVLWLGPGDLFLMYNDAYAQILGDKHPAALGCPAEQVWWEIWQQISPMLTSVIDTGVATWSDDLMLPLMTGGQSQERYFTFTYSPIIGGDGAVTAIFCAVIETTDRVLSGRRLHLLNAVATAVLDAHAIDDAVSSAVAVCDAQPLDLPFIAVYVSGDGEGARDSTLRGATPSIRPLLPGSLAELTGRDGTPRSRAARVIDRLEDVIPGITELFGENCPRQALVLPLGETSNAGAVVIGVSARRPLDSMYRGFCQLLADQLSAAFASVVSYEQQRRRADALAELDRAKTAFLTNVSHEFRTPLTLLLGPLDDALSEAAPGSVLADRLSTAGRNARRLQRLVESLLDFSRIEAGRANAKLVCTDVGALTAHIASSFTELCHRAGLELVVDCSPVLADLDPGMWETIILNLLSNAVKYTLRGSISIEVRAEPAHCVVTMRDTGVGIAAEDLDRLFDRFYRADNLRGRSVEGTGIGLSLVRGLVELHSGTVEIDSELDRGTTVTIRLPQSIGAAADQSPVGPLDETNPYVAEARQWLTPISDRDGSTAASERSRHLVLIADDNADMRHHLDRVLSAHWETVLAADGESALAAIRNLRPDAIVTDVMMPGIDGFGLVSAIRADPELAATPVLMLSARAGAEAVDEGYAAGADDYLPKPFRSQELVDRVKSRLSAVARERDRQRRVAASDLVQLDSALQATDSVVGIMDALLESPFGSGDAATVTIGVLDGERHIRFEYAGHLPGELRDRYHVTELDSPVVGADVVRTGESMVITDTFDLPPRYQHAVQDTAGSVRACVAHPLRDHAGRVIGVLALLWPTPRQFDAAERDAFSRVAELTSSALDRVRVMAREHRIAVDFQEHLLDLDRGSTAAVVAAVYQPAGEAMRVGGDWYSVTPLDRAGRVGISVGDVVGHGLPAAIVMSRLRAAVAASALTAGEPSAVLGALDRYGASVAGARCATVAYALVETEPDTGCATVSYSCAGHPYPLLVFPDHRAVFLTSGRRLPVAIKEHDADSYPSDATATANLPPGSLILLYTDGLIERAGETLDDGLGRLKAAAAECADLPVESVCAEVLSRLAPPTGYRDDVVVLALRPSHETPRSFATVVTAAPGQIPVARDRLREWLASIAVAPKRELDILLATGEAVTNAVEHGSDGEPRRTVSVEAFLRQQTLAVTVSDTGRWVGDSSASLRSRRRGRGLTLIGGLADHVDTLRTAGGTRVTLRFDHAVPAG